VYDGVSRSLDESESMQEVSVGEVSMSAPYTPAIAKINLHPRFDV
jgi:hypothetical protein